MPFEMNKILNKTEIMDQEYGSSSYAFLPEWRDQMPKSFGLIQKDIRHQRGYLVE